MNIPSSAKVLDPQVSARGAKYALIDDNTLKIEKSSRDKDHPFSSPFGVSTFKNDDATQTNIEFIISPAEDDKMNHVYSRAIEYLSSHNERFF